MKILINTGYTKYFENNSSFNLKLSFNIIDFIEESKINKNGLFLLHLMKYNKTVFIKEFKHQKLKYYVGN